MRKGYVYVLSNESMPGIVKIGKSTRGGRHRAKEIYQTGVPTPFALEFEMMFDDSDEGETLVHEALWDRRISKTREFFRVEVGEAVIATVTAHMEGYDHQVMCADIAYAAEQVEILSHRNGLFILDTIYAMHCISDQAVKDSVAAWKADQLNEAKEINHALKSENTGGD